MLDRKENLFTLDGGVFPVLRSYRASCREGGVCTCHHYNQTGYRETILPSYWRISQLAASWLDERMLWDGLFIPHFVYGGGWSLEPISLIAGLRSYHAGLCANSACKFFDLAENSAGISIRDGRDTEAQAPRARQRCSSRGAHRGGLSKTAHQFMVGLGTA